MPNSERREPGALAQKDVSRSFARDVFRALITRSTHIDVVEEMFSGTE
jgi:hypothetical protein